MFAPGIFITLSLCEMEVQRISLSQALASISNKVNISTHLNTTATTSSITTPSTAITTTPIPTSRTIPTAATTTIIVKSRIDIPKVLIVLSILAALLAFLALLPIAGLVWRGPVVVAVLLSTIVVVGVDGAWVALLVQLGLWDALVFGAAAAATAAAELFEYADAHGCSGLPSWGLKFVCVAFCWLIGNMRFIALCL